MKKKGTTEQKKRNHSSGSSDEEELIEMNLLQKEREVSKELKKKNNRLQERMEVLERRNDRLEHLLHKKLGKLYLLHATFQDFASNQ